MDKVTEAKNEFRIRQWTQIIQTCQSSGMPIVTWCKQNNVNTKTYYYWLRKLRTLACESEMLIPHRNEHPIVPVSFKQAKTDVAITIHMSSISIDVHVGASKVAIETVLTALKIIC